MAVLTVLTPRHFHDTSINTYQFDTTTSGSKDQVFVNACWGGSRNDKLITFNKKLYWGDKINTACGRGTPPRTGFFPSLLLLFGDASAYARASSSR